MEVSDSLSETISGLRMLGDIITGLSTVGVGAVIFTWSRMLGIQKDADLSDFQKPLFLILPLFLFLIAIIAGYILSSSLIGFYYEITVGVSEQGEVIKSATDFFKNQFQFFSAVGLLQLVAGTLAILSLAGWYAWNVRRKFDS